LRNIQDRPFETKTKTKTSGLKTKTNRSRVLSRPRPWSRGLHPWKKALGGDVNTVRWL